MDTSSFATQSTERPLISAMAVQTTPEGSLYVVDGENILIERIDSGQLRTYRPETITVVGENIEVVEVDMQEPSTSRPPQLFPEEDDLDQTLLGEALTRQFEVDSGSEVDEYEFTQEELQEDFDEEKEMGRRPESLDLYNWEEDFLSFRGEKEDFHELAGPKFEGTTPIDLFLQIWDQPIMEMIVDQTNLYAWQTIVTASEVGIPPRSRLHDWVETSTPEVYRLMAIFILMGICQRNRIDEYWSLGILGMPEFRKLMSIDRYLLLMRFLHFVDNYTITNMTHGHEKKSSKIASVLNYLNEKFCKVYTPRRELSIDESLLLWKGHLSWRQCIRTKAARFGIKTYELCEAVSGYCLNITLYAGKGTTSSSAVMGFNSASSKIVLNLIKDYLGKGFCLFMDNFYNSIPLTRFLKQNKTDVVGTLNRRCLETPQIIKNLIEKQLPRGHVTSRHCGDVSVISWKDVRLVTMVSTYHNNVMYAGRRAGETCLKPIAVHDYNLYMGGVDLKDQMLSSYLLERKRGLKWYIKVFRRLLNISILNSYVIYCANIDPLERKLTHRLFRYKLVEELCQRFGVDVLPRNHINRNRFNSSLSHCPIHKLVDEEERNNTKQNKLKRGRCVRCTAKRIQKTSNIVCSACDVFLCVGQCWVDYHTKST